MITVSILKKMHSTDYALLLNGHYIGGQSFCDVRRILRQYHKDGDELVFEYGDGFFYERNDYWKDSMFYVNAFEALELVPYIPYGIEIVERLSHIYGRKLSAISVLHGYVPRNTAVFEPYCGKYGIGFKVQTHNCKDVCNVEYYCAKTLDEVCMLPSERDAIRARGGTDDDVKKILKEYYKKL